MDDKRQKPYGLALTDRVKTGGLRKGRSSFSTGMSWKLGATRTDPGRTRLVLILALGLPPGTNPDQREIQLICPSDMLIDTAEPRNIELALEPCGGSSRLTRRAVCRVSAQMPP